MKLVGIVALALCLVAQTGAETFAQSSSKQADGEPGALTTLSINTDTGSVTWSIELAVTPEETARGLMFRKTMEKQHGMLFQFGQPRIVEMWMKNTFIPLDMIFFDNTGRISHIHKGAVPQSLDIISSQVPASYVLEVNAGEADEFGLQVGQSAKHPWFAGG
ncbi:MAG: DUF192 domain-containing protein [Pseudomonadota bacterium]